MKFPTNNASYRQQRLEGRVHCHDRHLWHRRRPRVGARQRQAHDPAVQQPPVLDRHRVAGGRGDDHRYRHVVVDRRPPLHQAGQRRALHDHGVVGGPGRHRVGRPGPHLHLRHGRADDHRRRTHDHEQERLDQRQPRHVRRHVQRAAPRVERPATATLALQRSNGVTSYSISRLTNGFRTTGGTGYLGASPTMRSVTFTGTLVLSNANKTVTFTVTGPCAGSCAARTATKVAGEVPVRPGADAARRRRQRAEDLDRHRGVDRHVLIRSASSAWGSSQARLSASAGGRDDLRQEPRRRRGSLRDGRRRGRRRARSRRRCGPRGRSGDPALSRSPPDPRSPTEATKNAGAVIASRSGGIPAGDTPTTPATSSSPATVSAAHAPSDEPITTTSDAPRPRTYRIAASRSAARFVGSVDARADRLAHATGVEREHPVARVGERRHRCVPARHRRRRAVRQHERDRPAPQLPTRSVGTRPGPGNVTDREPGGGRRHRSRRRHSRRATRPRRRAPRRRGRP